MLNAPWRRISRRMSSAGWSALMYSLDVQRDDVGVLAAAEMILRHLGARNDQHVVLAPGAVRLFGDVGQVAAKTLLGHREMLQPERRDPAGALEQVALHQDVVGDRDDVESSGLSVQIDDFSNRQATVTPASCGRESRTA